ncbi:MAG: hypothetical protein KGL39_01150 [Patescibacteria group bacterium]|nr:hypothetical protein [Patescibacteria group bacterium]
MNHPIELRRTNIRGYNKHSNEFMLDGGAGCPKNSFNTHAAMVLAIQRRYLTDTADSKEPGIETTSTMTEEEKAAQRVKTAADILRAASTTSDIAALRHAVQEALATLEGRN